MNPSYTSILCQLQSSSAWGPNLRREAMQLLSSLPGWNWCGIYRLEGETLVLDEYVGAATDHTHIPVGRGVCGTAVSENRNQVIADVQALDNYLACSLETKSELVVLIRDGSEILGQIDIDGHRVGQFACDEEAFLDQMATILAERWN
jgi:L-methionine (R)-S-oxide reductase